MKVISGNEKTATRMLCNVVYAIALAGGGVSAAYTWYILLVFLIIFRGAMFGYSLLPTALTTAYVVIVALLVWRKSWEEYKYKPQVWVPVLLALPAVLWGTYLYMRSLRGI